LLFLSNIKSGKTGCGKLSHPRRIARLATIYRTMIGLAFACIVPRKPGNDFPATICLIAANPFRL